MKKYLLMSSAAVVIGALRVKIQRCGALVISYSVIIEQLIKEAL